MYQISESVLAGKKTLTIKHSSTGNYASVIVGYGGAINEFVVQTRHILMGAGNKDDFDNLSRKAYAGNQLFPYPNRVNQARYNYKDQHFILPDNDDEGRPHALHGLIYDTRFEISRIDEPQGKLEISYQFKSLPDVYPFDFEIRVSYQLDVNKLTVRSSIVNTGNTTAPLGHGWHPYIRIYGNMNECKMQLPATDYYLVNDSLIPNGQTAKLNLFEQEDAIGGLELNHCFKLPETEDFGITTIKDTGFEIKLKQEGYSYIQYYTPPDRKSIAIEPQTCIADALNNHIGLIYLQPGKMIDLSFEITANKLTENE